MEICKSVRMRGTDLHGVGGTYNKSERALELPDQLAVYNRRQWYAKYCNFIINFIFIYSSGFNSISFKNGFPNGQNNN